jgi:hypothetical protein
VNARLEVRLLAHSIDATTFSAGRPRRRGKAHGTALTIALGLAALALLAFGWR